MKIGLLTLPLHTNYGGILQVFALQTILKRMGHEVVVLDKSPYQYLPTYKKPYSYSKRIIKKYFLDRGTTVFFEENFNKEYDIVSQYTQQFISKYIDRIEVNDLGSLRDKGFDAFVVGSDQIWRPKYYPKIENAFLGFTKGWEVKRIAYAPSFGTDSWEYTDKQTKACRHLIKSFDAISVREKSGVDLCRKYLNIEANHVADPTILLNKEDYVTLFEKANIPKSNGNLLTYVLDHSDEIDRLVKQVAEREGLSPFKVNSRVEDPRAPLNERIQPPLEEWIRGFYDADFVITDSFHACVFSILFNKPFLVIGNKSRGLARFKSLLSVLGMEDRLILNVREYDIKASSNRDTFDRKEKLSEFKNYSYTFLENSLQS